MRIVSYNIAHDSSVCSYNDGKIEYYCKEERLSRVKRDQDPFLALEKYKNQNFGKVDKFLYLTPSNIRWQFSFHKEFVKKHFGCELENYSGLNHHDCHASISFYNSGFPESLVFVIDRNGSLFFVNNDHVARESESVYIFSYPDKIKSIYKSFWLYDEHYKLKVKNLIKNHYSDPDLDINVNSQYSIVKVYEAATTLIGQHSLENGKTMGLSSYGDNIDYPQLFVEGNPIGNYFSSIDVDFSEPESSCFYGHENKITRNITKNNYQFYANKSKHVQIETQNEVLRLIKKYVDKTGIKNVCISGGYGLNVVSNNFYVKNLPDVNFYFEPLSDDSGITLGACMLKYREETKDEKIYEMSDNFYHFYENDNEIYGDKKTISDLVNLLEDQKIIAIFQGSPESGPRALGHRSLLFDPRNINGKEIVNTLKMREWYRPFAGVILEEQFSNYFDTLGLSKSEYMTINFESKPGVSEYLPSIIHVDNTCRIQTVSKKNKFLYNLLKKFKDKTGCPVLLNTSFNLAGQPLVQSKKDAVNFFESVKTNEFFGGIYFVDDQTLLSK